jgi:hypothetical protein
MTCPGAVLTRAHTAQLCSGADAVTITPR